MQTCDVSVEISIFKLIKKVREAHEKLSVISLCMVCLLAEIVGPSATGITPISGPPLGAPWVAQLNNSVHASFIISYFQYLHD